MTVRAWLPLLSVDSALQLGSYRADIHSRLRRRHRRRLRTGQPRYFEPSPTPPDRYPTKLQMLGRGAAPRRMRPRTHGSSARVSRRRRAPQKPRKGRRLPEPRSSRRSAFVDSFRCAHAYSQNDSNTRSLKHEIHTVDHGSYSPATNGTSLFAAHMISEPKT